MNINTTRFGTVNIPEDRVFTFPKGLPGFEEARRFVLLHDAQTTEPCFYWLQSVDQPDLAFLITDPTLFYDGYQVPVRPEQAQDLQITDQTQTQIMVIVNRIDRTLYGNLQGPLVLNCTDRIGEQVVLAEKRWGTRERLIEVTSPAVAIPA